MRESLTLPSIEAMRVVLRDFGFALILIGIPLGLICDMFVADIGWNALIPPFGLLLVCKWRRALAFRFPAFSNAFLFAGLYILAVWLYAMLIPSPVFESKYWFFVTALYFAMMTLKPSDFRIDRIIDFICLIGFVVICGTLYCEFGGVWASEEIDKAFAGRLTMGFGCVTAIIAILFRESKRPEWPALQVILVCLAFAAISFNGKRTAMLVTILTVALYLFRYKRISMFKLFGLVLMMVAVSVLMTLSMEGSDLTGRMTDTWDGAIAGIHDLFTGEKTSGNESASMRYHAMQWAFHEIQHNFSWLNFLLGEGILTQWLDIPILQSYIDTGVPGFLVYTGLTIVYPLYCCFSKAGRNKYVFFAAALNFYTVFSSWNSGHPYTSVKWAPLLFLLLIMSGFHKNCSHK